MILEYLVGPESKDVFKEKKKRKMTKRYTGNLLDTNLIWYNSSHKINDSYRYNMWHKIRIHSL